MFYILMKFSDGQVEKMDTVFDTYESAAEAGEYYCECFKVGGELLNMSNPGDYPLYDEKCEYDVIEK